MNKKVYQLATEITYAQDKSIEISVDDWADKIETLLKEAHDTEDGYCCACEADLAFFHSQLKEREEGYRAEIAEIGESIIGCIDSEIGCIKGGNALTGGEQEIAIEVAKNIKTRILNDIPN